MQPLSCLSYLVGGKASSILVSALAGESQGEAVADVRRHRDLLDTEHHEDPDLLPGASLYCGIPIFPRMSWNRGSARRSSHTESTRANTSIPTRPR